MDEKLKKQLENFTKNAKVYTGVIPRVRSRSTS